MQLLNENYNQKKHGLLKYGHDAFGNILDPEKGYRLLKPNEKIKSKDKHFDIYAGWVSGGEAYAVRSGHYCGDDGGRWTAWERKVS